MGGLICSTGVKAMVKCARHTEIPLLKSTLIVWYFVSNKHYFIEQKRGKKKYVIFLVLGKLLKRWWNACGSVSPPLIKDGFFALHHLFIKRKVGIFAFRHILTEM